MSELDIQCLVLKHEPQKFETYNDEIEYLISHEQRNKFITNLTLDLKGNTLVLFARVEAHGEMLYNQINNKRDNRKVFFVHGGVDAEEREVVREITERENNAIIVASYGTFSTGINIKTSIMLSLPLQVSPESEIFKVLDEFLEKEKTK